MKEINTRILADPIEIEFEKVMDIICIEKKKYLGIKTIDEGKICEIPKLLIKGVAPVRGDTLPFIKIVYKQLIKLIFIDKASREQIVAYYNDQMERLKQGRIDRSDLVLSKKLNQAYSSLTAPMNVYARYLTELQRPAQPGTKLEFLIIKSSTKCSVG